MGRRGGKARVPDQPTLASQGIDKNLDAAQAGYLRGADFHLHGADDPVVPDDRTLSFWKEMRDAKANWEFMAYEVKRYTPSPTGSCRKTARRLPSITSKPINAPGSPCRIS